MDWSGSTGVVALCVEVAMMGTIELLLSLKTDVGHGDGGLSPSIDDLTILQDLLYFNTLFTFQLDRWIFCS